LIGVEVGGGGAAFAVVAAVAAAPPETRAAAATIADTLRQDNCIDASSARRCDVVPKPTFSVPSAFLVNEQFRQVKFAQNNDNE
jgi:hypothetical protein